MRALPTPNRRRGGVLLAAVVALCLLGTACDPGRPPAATVAGHDITQASLQVDLKAQATVGTSASSSAVLPGDGKDTYTMDAATGLLTDRIRDMILAEYLAKENVKVTAADRSAGEPQICSNAADATGCEAKFKKAPKEFRDFLIGFQAKLVAASNAYNAKFYEPKARQAYDQAVAQGLPQADELCFNVGQFPDQASADQAKTAVLAGTPLATVAAATPSAQAGQGEQCTPYVSLSNPQSGAPQELLDAKAGQVVTVADPTSGQVLVVQVTKRDVAPYASLKSVLITAVQQQQSQTGASTGLQAAIIKTAVGAHVTVNPQFGSWDLKSLAVVPPKLPAGVTTTTLPAANPAGSATTGG